MALLRFVFMSLLLSWCLPALAQGPAQGPHVRIALVAESDRPIPGGEVMLAFDAVPDKGWHAYWQNPGDAGLPLRAEWTLPKGMSAGEVRYPVPQRLSIAGLMNYVFEGPYALLVPVRVPADAALGRPLSIRVKLSYLVCTDAICVPETAELATTITPGDGAIMPERRARFDGWRAALPKPLGTAATFQAEGGRVRLAIPYPADAPLTDAYFFPSTREAIDYAAPQTVTRDGDRLVVETALKGTPAALEGVLAIDGHGLSIAATPGTVAPARPQPAAAAGWQTALLAFAGAVLGGMLLNVMPCVFPILSLKALSLAKANGGNPRGEALAYTAGVVLVCLALGGILLALRAGGATVGWAFQLQDPRVILLLLLLVLGIALNLAGLFEMTAPGLVNRAASRGHGGAFATGALAAFIATPCSGPFMASALGAALVLPSIAALAVFAGLGLGIALPFLLLGFVPALRRRLPRPGAWMTKLRHILAVPMFVTAAALLWVLWRQTGSVGLAIGVLAALLTAVALWRAGRRQAQGFARPWLAALPFLILAVGSSAALRPVAAASGSEIAGAEPFSEARLAQLREERRPVFVYFTADWCLTCKVNEQAVIGTLATAKALRDGNVAVLVGDWTNGDPVLGRFIERHNRAGVPLYLWYRAGAAEPEVLPQILSQSLLSERAAAR